MKDAVYFIGCKELEYLKKYAKDFLDNEERFFIHICDEKARENDNSFLFNEIGKLDSLWKKYKHLKPFIFQFDPQKIIPEIFNNQTAFVIWTLWRSWHLRGKEDLEGAALAAAKVLSKYQTPYSLVVKEQAIKEFGLVMEYTGFSCLNDLKISFWENIFPYLEGKWEFKYEVRN